MNIATTMATLFSASLASATLGILTWWFIRRRRKEMHMPIVRILDVPQTKLPKVVLRKPPLVSFLAFALAAAAFVLWTAEPRSNQFVNHAPKQLRVHIFVDMSSSVSAEVTLSDLAQTVRNLWGGLHNVARATLSTSHSDTIYDVQEASKVEDIIQGLGFHRAGTRMGTSLKKHLQQTGEIDRLIIVSDRDQSSWLGFQWKYFSDDKEVFWFNPTMDRGHDAVPNAFINNARLISGPAATLQEWDVEIAQGGVAKTQEGSLRARLGSFTLGTGVWKLNEGRRSVAVHVSWPSRTFYENLKSIQATDDEPIVWEIAPKGDDAIQLDNEFRSTVSGAGGVVKVVAEPSGEQPLEDPGSVLQTVFQVMGVATERVDTLQELAPNPAERTSPVAPVDLIAALGGNGSGVSSFCPFDGFKRLWLTPWSTEVDHRELCECLAAIQKWTSPGCDKVHSRSEWIDWLQAHQGQQIGGQIGQSEEALAFGFFTTDKAKNAKSILALTIPLQPAREFNIPYSKFPVLVRQLYFVRPQGSVFEVMTESRDKSIDWPRIQDIAENSAHEREGQFFSARENKDLSNVPIGESLLSIVALTDLPRSWSNSDLLQLHRSPGKLDSEDPLPWIRVVVITILAASIIEGLYLLKSQKRRRAAVVTGLAVAGWIGAERAHSEIELNFYRPTFGRQLVTFNRLATEIEARTSIELIAKPRVSESLADNILQEPWLWTASYDGLVDPKGNMLPKLARWIRRGGFLLVESEASDDQAWDHFVRPLSQGTFRPLGWNPVPLDHELMRSFYLIATLPSCNGRLWRWYGLDGRLAILQAPYQFSSLLMDQPTKGGCESVNQQENQFRVFVNLMMVALTTDYKRDQIHLPEILKRLRSP